MSFPVICTVYQAQPDKAHILKQEIIWCLWRILPSSPYFLSPSPATLILKSPTGHVPFAHMGFSGMSSQHYEYQVLLLPLVQYMEISSL